MFSYYRRNADDRLRRLEREVAGSDSPESHNALFLERIRAGLINSKQAELLTAMELPPALATFDRAPRVLGELLLAQRKITVCRWSYEASKLVFPVWEKFLERLIREEGLGFPRSAEPSELLHRIETWFIKPKNSERFQGEYWSMDRIANSAGQVVRNKYSSFITHTGNLAHEINRPREAARQALLSLGRTAQTLGCSWVGKTKPFCVETADDAHDTAVYALLNIAEDLLNPETEQRIRQQVAEETAWAMYYWMLS
jgi:hypothetical protein